MSNRLQVGDVVQAIDNGNPVDIYGVITHVMDETGVVANPYSGRWTTGNYFMGQERRDLKLILRIGSMHYEAFAAMQTALRAVGK
jgi:hypothetical protein